jgi:hypothetical protein
MANGLIHFDAADFPAETQPCLRCGEPVPLVFSGPCERCTEELRVSMGGEARDVDAAYVPKMNVTPNAVALKDD